jgi:AraC-like DNA-binding protein
MPEGLVFGWRTALLSVAFAIAVTIAFALLRPLRNRVANRVLAALLVVLAGIITPWMIGFAGLYDRWPWLTFAPFAITLAVAPLFHLYVVALTTGRLAPYARLMLTPALLQFAYLAVCFLLPLPVKWAWEEASSLSYALVTNTGIIAGFAGYGHASFRRLGSYRKWLAGEQSDEHRFALRWLSRALSAICILLPVWAAYIIADMFDPLGYRGLMGLYVAIAAFAIFLAIEGWRHADLGFPHIESPTPISVAPAERDWQAQAAVWAAAVREHGWHNDPELGISQLARLIGTNKSHLSRALNQGLGENFAVFINRLRSEDVARALRDGRQDDLLDLALDAGFNSKATFNRAFARAFGMSPSDYRRVHASKQK